MAGARGDALDWVLALARAPAERHALRERPLPDGIEGLLQIAAGNPRGGALQAAMARTGESEAALVEMVRFYLREVLFHANADAYRVLGLTPAAEDAQIKAHHRLLQQWLHPDRQTSDWDAIFSARVNVAWNALRSADRRARYDAARPASAAATAAPQWARARVLAVGATAVEAPGSRWRRRAPVLALFVACGVLGIAAIRDAQRTPDSVRYGNRTRPAQADPDPGADVVALQLPRASHAVAPKDARPAKESTRSSAKRASAPVAPPVTRTPVPAMDAAPVAPASDTRPWATSVSSLPATAAPPGEAAAPMLAVPIAAANLPPDDPPATTAPVPSPRPLALTSSGPPAAASMPANVPLATSDVPSSLALAHVRAAQHAGRQLLAFLATQEGGPPPIWDSMAAQQRALGIRDALHASGEPPSGDPQWQVGRDQAAVEASFGNRTRVRAQLVWREERWLVSSVSMEIRQ